MHRHLFCGQIIDALTHVEGVSLIYLFGSQLTGTVGPMSDTDLGILVDRDIDGQAIRARFAHELSCILKTDRIDVVLLNQAPIELAYAIIAQGHVLYQRDLATRVEYEADVMSRYGDYLPVLRSFWDDILKEDQHA